MVSVRRLGPPDAPAYRAIRLKGLQSDPRAFSSDYAEEAGMDAAWFAARIEGNTIFGGFSDTGSLVAAVGYDRLKGRALAHRGQVWGMIVLPEARGQGTARTIMEALIAHARHAGVGQLHLGVGTYNAPAIGLYESLGFTRYGTEPRALLAGTDFIDEHLMVLKLDKEDDHE